MTNAQSKMLVCAENFPIPYLPLSAQQRLVREAMKDQFGKVPTRSGCATMRHIINYSYELDRFVVRFELL